MTVFDTQSELIAPSLRSKIAKRLTEMKVSIEPSQEIILKENPHRFCLFPIKYHEIWEFYKKAEASFRTVEDVDLSKDLID
jgi:ribonucleotide reductase beta subunit family protein with ferritin-like domain